MSRERKYAIVYYIISAIAYVCAAIWFFGGRSGLGVLWLCIGSANLCLGSVWIKKSREAENPEKKDDSKTEE